MADLLRPRAGRVMIESESSYGTDAVQAIFDNTSKDIIYQVVGDDISIENQISNVQRSETTASTAALPEKRFKSHNEISMTLPLLPFESSDAETPHYSAALKAMNFSEDLTGTDKGVYSLQTDEQSSATIYYWQKDTAGKARLHYALGCYLTGTIQGEVGGLASIDVSGQGLYQQMTTSRDYFNSNGNIALDKNGNSISSRDASVAEKRAQQTPFRVRNMTLTIGSTTYEVTSFSVTLGLQQDQKSKVQAKNSVSRIVQGREPDGQQIEMELAEGSTAFDDALSKAENGNRASFNAQLTNGTDTLDIDCPNVQLRQPTESEKDQFVAWTIAGKISGDHSNLDADGEIKLTYQ